MCRLYCSTRCAQTLYSTRVQPSLPSIFLHGFARQCRTCAAKCTGALFTTLLSQYDFNTATCSGASPLVAPRLRKRETELLLAVCALCFVPALDCANGFVVDSNRPCHCFGQVLRAWNQIRLEHGGGQLSQFCRVDQRQSRQRVHQAPSGVSFASPSAAVCLTARRPCPSGASSGLRLPQESISKSVISKNVAQIVQQ